MPASKKPRIALIWPQFSAYHVDRCEAVAARLAGRAEVLAIEVATTSELYAWEPSGEVAGARKLTLFPGRSHDKVPLFARLRRQFAALRGCDAVFFGIGYHERDVIALSWLLRLWGLRVVVMSESKFDDFPRAIGMELFKALLLSSYDAAIVGARRQKEYFRFLGYRRRKVLPGYDCVGLDRIRAQGGGVLAPAGTRFEDRPFVFVGRFVAKKNLAVLVEGYARYARLVGPAARRLVLVGSGEEEAALRRRVDDLGLTASVDFPGFLGAEEVSRVLAGALALVLVSTEEQWGLVVNEALAFGLPAIVSTAVGSRDTLVRGGVNGFVVEPDNAEGIGRAMLQLASSRADWERMVAASHERAWMGDAERLADAVECILFPGSEPATSRIAELEEQMESQIR